MIYADDILTQAAETYRTKRLEYGDSYTAAGEVIATIYGVDRDEAVRGWLVTLIVTKLTRYAYNIDKGHRDSLRDMIVYTAMLEAYDTNHNLTGAKNEPTKRTP